MKPIRLLKRLVRAVRSSWRRDKRAFQDITRTLADWSEVKVPGPKLSTKPIAKRYRVAAHTRADGTRVKAHWRRR